MNWREELNAYIRREANPPYKYAHQPRLYALTRTIAANTAPPITYDDDVVYAAAFLHDLGVFIGHRPEEVRVLKAWDHVAYVRAKAPSLLAGFGFPAEKVALVIACIEQHMPSDTPQSMEAALLRDADILEQLGAIGILRAAAKLASDTRFHQFSDVRNALRRAAETLPDKLVLDAAKELARRRCRTLTDFLDALDAEANEHLD